jgi:Nucleotidyl transferase AbiEii toxin, Type IV TA system
MTEEVVPSAPEGLTPFQAEVARAFFDLPESREFLLAGGAGLVAQGLTTRSTQDLNFFTSPGPDRVPRARDALQREADRRGWSVHIVRDHDTFCRLVLARGSEQVLVDLAVDSVPGRPAVVGVLGPTFAAEELYGRKTIALFDRAEARDFADVYILAARFGRDALLRSAAEVDRGFDTEIFAQMLSTLSRFRDEDIPVAANEVAALRAFFADWTVRLRAPG